MGSTAGTGFSTVPSGRGEVIPDMTSAPERHPARLLVAPFLAQAEAKLWAAVAALEETAALARHLSAHAEAGDDLPGQADGTAEWAASLAESVRAQMRDVQS
jgi:hypothetical protein